MERVLELAPPDDDLLDFVAGDPDVSDDEYDCATLAAFYKMECSIAAKKLRLLADLHRAKECRGDLDTEWFADTVAAETRASVGRVSNDLALALRLTDNLPRTLELLAAGELDLHRVRVIADAARSLTAERCVELERQLYPDALSKTVRQLARHVNRLVVDLDPAAAEERRARCRADRHVRCEPVPDTGMGWLTAYLPGEDLMAVGQRLDALATGLSGDQRTMDQRRADALRDLLLHVPASTNILAGTVGVDAPVVGDDHGACSRTRAKRAADRTAATDCGWSEDSARITGREVTRTSAGSSNVADAAVGIGTAATIYVTASAETLLGLGQRAGQMRGYGPITADHVRDLAYRLQSQWVGVLVDDAGRALTMTRDSYRFRGRLAEFIRLRDTACTHPGCDRPADRCDIDHVIPWPRGQTTPDNASTECRRHHRLKTHTDWSVTRRETKSSGQNRAEKC